MESPRLAGVRSCFIHSGLCHAHGDPSASCLCHLAGGVWTAGNPVKEGAGQTTNGEAALCTYQRKSRSTPGASVLGLGGGAVPSLGGCTMNLASGTLRYKRRAICLLVYLMDRQFH